jgi:ribosomal protein S18 acetylase RimI-like enzyme
VPRCGLSAAIAHAKPEDFFLQPELLTRNPAPKTLHPRPCTQPSTQHPKPKTSKPPLIKKFQFPVTKPTKQLHISNQRVSIIMTIKSLQNVPASVLAQTFNDAFADYIVPIRLSETDMLSKMAAENTSLQHSAGVFNNNQLIGFILIGTDQLNGETIAYNGGTGVIPEFRGQKLTEQMYRFVLPRLAEENIHRHQLEVITSNIRAVPAYEKTGFVKTRIVTCFKGQISPAEKDIAEIRREDFPDESVIAGFRDFEPTYQNSWRAILRGHGQNKFLAARINGDLAGYIIYSEATARIRQFGVAHEFRGKGIGHQLFDAVQRSTAKPLTIINVDDDRSATHFLQNIGMEITVQQYEMAYHFEE